MPQRGSWLLSVRPPTRPQSCKFDAESPQPNRWAARSATAVDTSEAARSAKVPTWQQLVDCLRARDSTRANFASGASEKQCKQSQQRSVAPPRRFGTRAKELAGIVRHRSRTVIGAGNLHCCFPFIVSLIVAKLKRGRVDGWRFMAASGRQRDRRHPVGIQLASRAPVGKPALTSPKVCRVIEKSASKQLPSSRAGNQWL